MFYFFHLRISLLNKGLSLHPFFSYSDINVPEGSKYSEILHKLSKNIDKDDDGFAGYGKLRIIFKLK